MCTTVKHLIDIQPFKRFYLTKKDDFQKIKDCNMSSAKFQQMINLVRYLLLVAQISFLLSP